MKIQPKDLMALGYCLDKELHHNELVPFVKQHLKDTNPFSIFYWAFNVASIVTLIFFIVQEDQLSLIEVATKVFLGFFLFFLVVLPIHELIHGILYKLSGAQSIEFTVHWRTLVFYCIADNFVTDAKSFFLIALSPFVLINGAVILLMCFARTAFFYPLFGALILHTGGCFGDFGLVSYFYNRKEKNPLTYDDAEGKKTYFFLKKSD
jgi:hypothetical protein